MCGPPYCCLISSCHDILGCLWTKNQLWLKAATILGCLGYVYVTHICKADHKKLCGGLENGREANLMSGCAAEVRGHFETKKAKGFNFKFDDKFHPFWGSLCQVKLLMDLACNGMLGCEIFPKKYHNSKSTHYVLWKINEHSTPLHSSLFENRGPYFLLGKKHAGWDLFWAVVKFRRLVSFTTVLNVRTISYV